MSRDTPHIRVIYHMLGPAQRRPWDGSMQSHRWFHHPASYWGTPIFRAGNLRAHDSEGYPYFRKSLYNQILGLDFHDIGCNQPEMILLDILQLGNLQRMFFQLGTVDSSIL